MKLTHLTLAIILSLNTSISHSADTESIFMDKLTTQIRETINTEYGRSNNPLNIGMGLVKLATTNKQFEWIENPTQWSSNRFAEQISSETGLSFKETRTQFLRHNSEATTCAYLTHFISGTDLTNYYIQAELKQILCAIELVYPDITKQFLNHPILRNTFSKEITEEIVLSTYKDFLENPENSELQETIKTLPYCYLHHYITHKQQEETLTSEVIPESFPNLFAQQLSTIFVNDTSNYLLAKASGLLGLFAPSDFDDNTDAHSTKWATFKDLRMAALNLDKEAYDLLIDSYHYGYFGIGKHRVFKEEAASYLALFALSGDSHYVTKHVESLTQGWFGVVCPKTSLMPEFMSLTFLKHSNAEAQKLLSLPPFSRLEITKEKILTPPSTAENSNDGCNIM